MTDPDQPDELDRPGRDARFEALAETVRPFAGWILFGFACFFVLLGYLGVANESVVAKQLPYLVSGGLGGVLLAILGASFLGMEELRRDSGRLDRMERQIEELHRLLLERPDAPAPADPTNVEGSGPAPPGRFVTVDAGSSFHRADCALVAGKDATEYRPGGSDNGLRPCPVCEPAPV